VKRIGNDAVWEWAEGNCQYTLDYHKSDGVSQGSSGARSLEDAIRHLERLGPWRDYEAQKRQLWRDYEAKLKELNATHPYKLIYENK
jgi:hypothetical protein